MIVIASDHRGYLLKEDLKTFFNMPYDPVQQKIIPII